MTVEGRIEMYATWVARVMSVAEEAERNAAKVSRTQHTQNKSQEVLCTPRKCDIACACGIILVGSLW